MSSTSFRVGLPRALFSYSFDPFWERFFRGLGVETVQSGPTTKDMVDDGIREAVSEACVPIKVYHGHVRALAGRVDAVFVPRYVNVAGRTVFCPKFLGLPDMIRHSMKSLPQIISPRIDMRRGRLALAQACVSVASDIGLSRARGIGAWLEALSTRAAGSQCAEPQEAAHTVGDAPGENHLRLAVLGYPYAILDRFLNMDLLRKLARLGVRVLTTDSLPAFPSVRRGLRKQVFWHYSDLVIRAAHYFIETRCVDGLIHVTAFGCGPDALTGKIIDIEAASRGMPFMALLLDEYTGEAGLMTRIEAFVDMVRRAASPGGGLIERAAGGSA